MKTLARMGLLLALFLACLLPRFAWAQSDEDKTTARKLFYEARDAYEAKEFARAADLFERSNALYPAPTAALGLARALVGAGKLTRAYETYASIARLPLPPGASDPFKDAHADAKKESAALEPRLASLVIRVRGPADPVVQLDGVKLDSAALGVKQVVDPGQRVIEAAGQGYEPKSQTVTVTEGESREVDFDLVALPAPVVPRNERAAAPLPTTEGMSTTRKVGLVLGGVGVVSLIAAGVTGGLYLSNKSTVDESCRLVSGSSNEFQCDTQEGADAAARGRTLGWVNAATLVGGIVATGAGVTLFVVGGREHAAVRATAGRVSIEGGF